MPLILENDQVCNRGAGTGRAPTDDRDDLPRPGAPHDSAVGFVGVRKSYDGRTFAVDGLDLEVKQGEFLTLLGPSGSGKTTTLMLLAGFEFADAGAITIHGKPVTHVPPAKRDIGIVFQNYALFPHMSVRQNVAFPLTARRVPRAVRAAKVNEALARVRMADFAERRPGQLSGGQQQRVALARALVFEPRLVLMDEPLGALDKQLREHLQIEIRRLHRDLGVTVVYVTHDQDEALMMSDRIAVFQRGRIAQLGPPKSLYARPRSAFVANFLGENNLLPGRVMSLDGDRCIVRLSDGTVFRANMAETLSAGAACLVSFRPEHVVADGGGQDAAGGCNLLPVDLLDVLFLGDQRKFLFRTRDGREVVMRRMNGAEARHGGTQEAERLNIPFDACLALPDGAA